MKMNLLLDNMSNKLHYLFSDRKFSEILNGSVWALAAKVIATGMTMVATVIIARFYGAEVMGIVAIINSAMLLSTTFSVMGTNTAILRLIPEHLVKLSPTSAFRIYRKTQWLVITISLITGTLFFFNSKTIAEMVFNKPNLSFFFSMAAVFIVFNSLMVLNTQAVRGLKLFRIFALMQTLPQGFNLMLLLLLSLSLPSLNVPVYAMLGSFAMTGISGWIIIGYVFKKRMQTHDIVVSMSVKAILTLSLPMFMSAAMALIISQTSVIMLGIFRPESDTGYYSVAVKLATLTSFILAAMNSIAAPKFSELFHTGQINELFRVAKKSTKLIFWTTTPILILLILSGRFILYFLFGQEYTIAYWAMICLIMGQFVHSISGSTGIFMNMTGNQKILRNIMIITVFMNIFLNLTLIPLLGINGAAIADMISTVGWNLLSLAYIKIKYGKTVGYIPFFRQA